MTILTGAFGGSPASRARSNPHAIARLRSVATAPFPTHAYAHPPAIKTYTPSDSRRSLVSPPPSDPLGPTREKTTPSRPPRSSPEGMEPSSSFDSETQRWSWIVPAAVASTSSSAPPSSADLMGGIGPSGSTPSAAKKSFTPSTSLPSPSSMDTTRALPPRSSSLTARSTSSALDRSLRVELEPLN